LSIATELEAEEMAVNKLHITHETEIECLQIRNGYEQNFTIYIIEIRI